MGRSLRFRRAVLGATLLAHLAQPLAGYAQVVADPAAARRPVVDAAANGVPLVQIVAPSGAGVSRNLYQQFNVDPRGLILNNSTGVVATQLGGYVAGNPQLGTPARIILNEVTGSAASMLRGYSEIAGSRAELVIANPNGITCAGCGFINASRGVLTTGTPVFGPLGTLDAFDVRRGTVTFEGAGLNARNVDQADVLARAIAVNAEIWANTLNVVAGANRVDYASLAATRIAGEGAAPTYALDVAAIGGMYADRIRLVGTEAGLGVNMRGVTRALAGELTLTAEGRLVHTGRLSAAGPAAIGAAAGVENSGTVYSQGSVRLSTAGAFANTGLVGSADDLAIDAATVASPGTLAAGLLPDGTLGTSGSLDVHASGVASLVGGRAVAGADLRFAAASIDASNARAGAGRDLALATTAGDLDTSGATLDATRTLSANSAGGVRNVAGTLYGEQSLVLRAGGDVASSGTLASRGVTSLAIGGGFSNEQGVLLGDRLDVQARSLANGGGTIEQLGASAGRIALAQSLDNRSGRIAAIGSGPLAITAGGDILNAGGFIGGNGALDVAAARIDNAGGEIATASALTLSASSLDNRGGSIVANADLAGTLSGALDNRGGGRMRAGGDASLRAGSIANEAGAISANRSVAMQAAGLTGAGQIAAGADLALTLGSDFTNPAGGELTAAGTLALTARGTLANAGRIDADVVRIQSSTLANTATLLGNRIEANADVVTNSGAAAVIGGAADVRLHARNALANTGGALILSGGDLAIAANASGARTGSLLNQGATIEAAGNVSIAAQSLVNERQTVNIATETVASSAVPYQLRDESWSPAVVGNPAYSPLIIEPADRLPFERQRVVTTTVTEDRVVTASAPAEILAGASLSIDAGVVVNHASRIASGGNGTIGGALTNQGYELRRVATETITHQTCGAINGASPGNLGSCASGWVDIDTTSLATTLLGAVPASVESAASLAIAGPAIRNLTLTPSGTPGSGLVTTLPPGVPGAMPIASAAGGATAPISLPASGLYTLRLAPGQPYLVETDPRFSSYGRFISSDYMLARLALDSAATSKKLGDAYYETQLIREEIYRLTGRRFLGGYASDYDTYLALMDEGLAAERRLVLRPGIALTDAQAAALTKDIVWLVEREVALPDSSAQRVLVPVVYLARATGRDLAPTGALIAADDIEVKTFGTLENSGTIAGVSRLAAEADRIENVGGALVSRGLTRLAAQGDLANRSGRIAGVDVQLVAGRDLVNETLTGTITGTNATQTAFGMQGRIESTGDLAATAGRDVIVRGAAVQGGATGDVALAAGRDAVVDTVVARDRLGTTSPGSHVRVERDANTGSTIASGGAVAVSAGRDATLTAAQVRAGTELAVAAGGNVTIGSTEDRSALSYRQQGKGWSAQAESDARTAVGSVLFAGNDALLAAGTAVGVPAATAFAAAAAPVPSSADLLVAGSSVTSGAGNVTLAATRDVVVTSVGQRQTLQAQESRSSRGFLSRTTTDEARSVEATVQVGSVVSGDSVTIAAGRDAAVRGSQVASTGDLAVQAARNVEIVSTESLFASSQSRSERRSGVLGGASAGVVGFTIGSQTQSTDVRESSVTNLQSVVGSSAGTVAIEAGETYRQRGADVIGTAGVDIRAADVTIEAAQDRYARDEQTRMKRSGLTVGVAGPVVSAAAGVREAVMRAGDVEDDRLKAVLAVRAARLGLNAVREAQAVASAPQEAAFAVRIGYGSAREETRTTTTSTATLPSTVVSSGDIAIRAVGDAAAGRGNLDVAGSRIQGGNVALSAARDLTLRSAQDTSLLESTQSASRAGAGVQVGMGLGGSFGFGVYGEAGRARGNEDGDTLAHAETIVTARQRLTLESGRDTTLSGAIASGASVAALVGRDLLLASQQDVETYRSRNQSGFASASAGLGAGAGSVSAFSSRIDSDYASVREQTAIRAGAGGFDIDVRTNTHLAGAVIDSSALPERNRLATGTLTFSDIENRAEYSASSVGGNVGVGGIGASGGARPYALPALGAGGGESSQSTTLAAVAPGTIEIRNPGAQSQDLATLSRNPGGANAALERIFDKKTVQEQQELAALFGQEAFFIVGEIAKSRTRPYENGELRKQTGERYLALKSRAGSGEATAQELSFLRYMESGSRPMTPETARQLIAEGEAAMAAGRADYDAWKEGSPNKVALHTLVGAVQAAFGGAPVAAGAAGAGVAESVRGITEGLSPELQQWASVVIGGAAGAMAGGSTAGAAAGAATGLAGEQFNRQLHPSEIARIRQLAPQFAKLWNISEVSEAEGRLVRQALRQVDASWAELFQSDDNAARVFLLSNAGGLINETGQTHRYFHSSTRREYEDSSLFASTVAANAGAYANALGTGSDGRNWNKEYNDRATNLLLVAAAPAGGEVLLAARGLIAAGTHAVRSCFANLMHCGNALGIQGLELVASDAVPTGVAVAAAPSAAKLAALAKADEEAAGLLRIGQNARANQYLDQLISQRGARDQLKSMVDQEVPIAWLGTIPGNSRATGDLGEQLAEQMLRRMGIEDITFLKNNSGHGVDRIIGYDPTRKEYVILEVKTSEINRFGDLPLGSPREFLAIRASRAESGTGQWKIGRTPTGTQDTGKEIGDNLRSGASVVGYKIEVSVPTSGDTGSATARISRWE